MSVWSTPAHLCRQGHCHTVFTPDTSHISTAGCGFTAETLLACWSWPGPFFSCDQTALWMVQSSFHPSVRHTFLPLSPPGWRGIVTVRAGHISVTDRRIFSIRSSVELSRPLFVYCHGHLPDCPIWACWWAKNLSNLPQIGSRLCGSHISEITGWMYPI